MNKVIMIALAMFAFQQRETIYDFFIPPSEFVAKENLSVTLYATSWCGYCQKTRQLLDERNIEYTEYDIEKSEKGNKEYTMLEGRGVPLLLIEGEVVRGYDRSRILELAGN